MTSDPRQCWRTPPAFVKVLVSPRINFVAPPGIKQSSNNRDSALIVFRHGQPGPADYRRLVWK
jgi:hypothetical protein